MTTDLTALAASLSSGELSSLTPVERAVFLDRVQLHSPDLKRILSGLYGTTHDIDAVLDRVTRLAATRYVERSEELRILDLHRQAEPDWFQSHTMAGYAGYVDRIGGTLAGIHDRIPYLEELGINYLHLLPFLESREGESDGGYAVADYRNVDERFGTTADLRNLTAALRDAGISLCVDVVCNHTADTHEWAKKARTGDATYQNYYLMFENRSEPDRYESTLREVFPEAAPGNFTWVDGIDKWVWTTFRTYQWDLNYRNPDVLCEMSDVILNLANLGAEILRLDAVAFMWKQTGTMSENLPEAHLILQFFRAITRLACPGVILKAEAIVPIDDTLPYLGLGEATGKECELAYHHFLMVLMWSALAEQNARLAVAALQRIPATVPGPNAWCTYVRSHDDIGWAITPEDAATAGLNDFDHRTFLTNFYTGEFPMSFARGVVFEENPKTMDRRVSGTTASLAGLEDALDRGDADAVELAYGRIRLLYAVAAGAGGIPIIWSTDELGATNDHTYVDHPDHHTDNRWLHRGELTDEMAELRNQAGTPQHRVFHDLREIVAARKVSPEVHSAAAAHPVATGSDHVLGILRKSARGRLLILANVTPEQQAVTPVGLRDLGFSGPLHDRLTDEPLSANSAIHLDPYDVMWVVTDRG